MPIEESLQKICGAFLACNKVFKDLVPAAFYNKVEGEISSTRPNTKKEFALMSCPHETTPTWFGTCALGFEPRFMLRHADQELLQLLTTTAPPADLNKVSMYASHMAKYREEARLCPIVFEYILVCHQYQSILGARASRSRTPRSSGWQSLLAECVYSVYGRV